VFGDRNLAKVRARLGWGRRTQCQVGWYNISSLIFRLRHGFFHDDLVQGTPKVNLDFIKNASCFNLTALFEVF